MSLEEMTLVDFKIADSVKLGLEWIYMRMDRESARLFFDKNYELFNIMQPSKDNVVWKFHITEGCRRKYQGVIASLPADWYTVLNEKFYPFKEEEGKKNAD
ncbi:MAG: hypothetical protein MJY78_11500 [Fibrobacter sp.]|nr:hypothetical protein [Fibrobacter sp.]